MKKLLLLLLFSAFFGHKTPGQTVPPKNIPSKTTSTKPVAEGPEVWGVFDGRVHCQQMALELNITVPENCEKLKWSFSFYQDPKTHQPTTYKLFGSLFRGQAREGKWAIVKGTKTDSEAVVFQLDPDKKEKTIFILKGDDNVLFILDKNKNLMVGDDYLSYTFNRVVN